LAFHTNQISESDFLVSSLFDSIPEGEYLKITVNKIEFIMRMKKQINIKQQNVDISILKSTAQSLDLDTGSVGK
jgi:hypothetical protein